MRHEVGPLLERMWKQAEEVETELVRDKASEEPEEKQLGGENRGRRTLLSNDAPSQALSECAAAGVAPGCVLVEASGDKPGHGGGDRVHQGGCTETRSGLRARDR